MRKFLILIFIFLFCASTSLGIFDGQAWAETKKISGTTNVEDAFIQNLSPNHNFGGKSDLDVFCNYITEYSYTLIRVKNVASELGANAINITAVCSLYTRFSWADNSVSAYRVFKPWVEGDEEGVDDDDGDITYNDWASDAYEWGTAGCGCAGDDGVDNSQDGTCDASGRDRKSTAESNVNVTTGEIWYSWSVSTELATGWYNETIAENGIVLVGSTSGGACAFWSTEYGVDWTLRPFWTFTYDVAEEGAMRVKDDWRFATHFMRDWRFQDEKEVGIVKIYADQKIMRIYENGEIVQIYKK